jgi:tRNA(fMet)-specific endonuclease VapC
MIYLLDADTCIAIMRGVPGVIAKLRQVSPGDCALSMVTWFELCTGVEKCRRPAREQAKIDLLRNAMWAVDFDSRAAQSAAKVRAVLEQQGKVIGAYDTLLAGHALALGLTLVSHNVREFSRVPGLLLEDWG